MDHDLAIIEGKMKKHPENCETYERQKMDVRLSATHGSTIATALMLSFETYVKSFTTWNSTLKYYPLIAAPSLIEMSLMVSVFEPLTEQLIKNQVGVQIEKLSCVIRNAIHDFLPLIIEARLEALSADQMSMIEVRKAPFNKNGYNSSNRLDCWASPCESTFSHPKNIKAVCLIDSLGATKYEHNFGSTSCEIGHAQNLRYLIEQIFEVPFGITNRACNRPIDKPTGNTLI